VEQTVQTKSRMLDGTVREYTVAGNRV
jgi:hypothetical protein